MGLYSIIRYGLTALIVLIIYVVRRYKTRTKMRENPEWRPAPLRKRQTRIRRVMNVIGIFVIFTILGFTPFEYGFLSYETPVQALRYTYPEAGIYDIIETENGAYVLCYIRGTTSIYLEKEEGKWKIEKPTNHVYQYWSSRKSSNHFTRYSVKKETQHLITVFDGKSFDTGKPSMVSDSVGSSFTQIKDRHIYLFCTLIGADVQDYTVTINGKQYQ